MDAKVYHGTWEFSPLEEEVVIFQKPAFSGSMFIFFRVMDVNGSLGILAHRTSDDEQGVFFFTETKDKVFRFHETILRRLCLGIP